MNTRKTIPGDIEHHVLDRSRRRCALCIHFHNDWAQKEGQIAHLDRDPSNSAEDNLAFLCLSHHDDYDTKRRQTKNLTIKEAKTARDRLYEFIENGGDLAQVGGQRVRQTLEATRESIIDASRAVIPGDLPFQFARADNGSVISMAGITVTRKPDGSFLVAPSAGSSPRRADREERLSLFNHRIQVLNTLTQSLRDARDFLQNAVRSTRFVGDLSIEEYRDRCVSAGTSAQAVLAQGRLLIPAELVDLCDQYLGKISEALGNFHLAQDPMVPHGPERAAFWDKASKIAHDEIPRALLQIEGIARSLIHNQSL
jgi:hypothetical protein